MRERTTANQPAKISLETMHLRTSNFPLEPNRGKEEEGLLSVFFASAACKRLVRAVVVVVVVVVEVRLESKTKSGAASMYMYFGCLQS